MTRAETAPEPDGIRGGRAAAECAVKGVLPASETRNCRDQKKGLEG